MVFSALSAQTISNFKTAYSCPCKLTVTYDLDTEHPVDVLLYYSPDIDDNYILATTFYNKTTGTNIIDVWNCEDESPIGRFYFKLVIEMVQSCPEGSVMINGVCWATRNVAAHGVFVENPEDYGALFQWGRKGDGHEQRTSPNYPTNNNNPEAGIVSGSGNFDINGQIVTTHPAYGKFIKQSANPWDWRSPSISTLWNSGTGSAPIKTANDPSPEGYRVPTYAEILSLTNTTYVTNVWTTENGINGRRFTDKNNGNSIFLPVTGYRNYYNGALYDVGTQGHYWSSTEYNWYSGHDAHALYFYNGFVGVSYYDKANGFSVRPVAE